MFFQVIEYLRQLSAGFTWVTVELLQMEEFGATFIESLSFDNSKSTAQEKVESITFLFICITKFEGFLHLHPSRKRIGLCKSSPITGSDLVLKFEVTSIVYEPLHFRAISSSSDG
eukprot:NODE_321_length_9805_cov_0.700185.p9 type:complete len:115 gc:universal NODE_321_length_9805_cov_0.700185:8541-8885(+)